MNIEKITAFGDSGAEKLKSLDILNPVELEAGRYIVTDGTGAIVFKHKYPKTVEFGGSGDHIYRTLTADFHAKTADVCSFVTTVGDLRNWLIKDTEPCTFCEGKGLCISPTLETLEGTTPELEDAEALHYGWIGPVPINRARLEELLSFPEASDDTKIVLTVVMHERPHQNSPEKLVPFYGEVWVQGPDWELFLAGLEDKSGEAAPKFHLEGVFTAPEAKPAGKKQNVMKTKPVRTPAKAAAPKKAAPVTKKEAPKVKAPPKKPVVPTKTVSKPAKSTGSSLLDKALAKKAAGRKKK